MRARLVILALALLAGDGVAQPAGAAPLTTVALDLTGLSAEDWKELDGLGLEKRVVLRLVQDGFAVVASTGAPEVRLTVTRIAAGVHLAACSRVSEAEVDVPVGREALAELHLELAQRSAELARRCAPPPPAPIAPTPPAPAPAPVPVPVAPAPPRVPIGLQVGGAAGFVVRQGGNDPAVRLILRYGRLLGAELAFGLLASGAGPLTVLELPITLGFSVRLGLPRGFALEGALAGGVRLQAFFSSDPAAAERAGLRVEAVGSIPITLSFWPVPWLGLGLRAAPGLASGTPPHTGWSRGPWWFEASGLVFLGF